ncbi:MAG: hypothetical protein SV765_07045 [Pseudomonadota bacterium]|nr:hypothetical protein [Pseudomonadota bacterium]
MLMNTGFHFENKYKYLILLLLTFVSSRMLFSGVGVEFDYSRADKFWQLLDLDELEHNLLESLFYLHSQPPIFNLITGLSLKIAPQDPGKLLGVFFHFLGFFSSLAMFKLFVLLNFSYRSSYLLTSLYFLLPSVVLYEFWFFYTWLVSCFFIFSAYALQKFVVEKSVPYAVCFFLFIVLICLTRSLYHMAYLLVVAATLVCFFKYKRATTTAIAVTAFVVVGGWYLKNQLIFGFFGASSWGGMSAWKMVKDSPKLDWPEEFSVISEIDEFSPIDFYPQSYSQVPEKFSSISVLNTKAKEGGIPNFNHYGYVPLSKNYLKMSARVASEYPANYLMNVVHAFGVYSKPSWEYFFLEKNRSQIQNYIRLFTMSDIRFFIEHRIFGLDRYFDFPLSSLLVVPFSVIIILIFSIQYVRFEWLNFGGSNAVPLVLFGVFSIVFTAVMGNLVEIGENHRFRFQTAPLLWVLFAMSIKWFFAGDKSFRST